MPMPHELLTELSDKIKTSEITRQDVEKAVDIASLADTKHVVGDSFRYFYYTLAVLESLDIPLDCTAFVEFGARQLDNEPGKTPYNNGISRFFMEYGKKSDLHYLAFDPRYSQEKMQRLEGRQKDITLKTFEDARIAIQVYLGRYRTPVIFSNNTLNLADPNLPYWQLPGLHVHQGSEIEMCRWHNLPEFGGERHVDFLKSRLGLDPATTVRAELDHRFVAKYHWVNLDK